MQCVCIATRLCFPTIPGGEVMPPTITLHITDQSGRILRSIDIPAPMRAAYPEGPSMFDPNAFDRLLDRITEHIHKETEQ
ncbi:hypothetical protein BW12_07000 [Bifidobacterium sp. UTCIF-3]|nr:hypothetical protein BW09_04745 [Bifidobacterium sp. UTCIF-1]TPF81213.1 hypothetical protein BW08_00835 [Bifidobacterium sp. UTCIF-24]TPF81994.1 hypothetical protein BW12_07000 [Bifidobacterium sp. UTCIF-3]TPF85158.1 hypothetical protein BW07_00350 [Bifidobacterium sp. UTCIF-36]